MPHAGHAQNLSPRLPVFATFNNRARGSAHALEFWKHSSHLIWTAASMSQQRVSLLAAMLLAVLAFAVAVFAQDEGFCQ